MPRPLPSRETSAPYPCTMDIDRQRHVTHLLLEPGDRLGHPQQPVRIEWCRSEFGTTRLNTWHANLVAPIFSVTFGQVSESAPHRWYAAVNPNGRGNPPHLMVRYTSRDTAIKHLECWVRYNWRRLPIQPLGYSREMETVQPARDVRFARPSWNASIDEMGAWIAHHG